MSVLLPAPFSPSRAWISPGSTVREIRSLATSVPNRLVMSRSSSLMGSHPSDRQHGGNGTGEVGVTRPPPYEELLLGHEPARYDLTGIEPSMMPALMVSSSPCRSGLTLSAKLWKS